MEYQRLDENAIKSFRVGKGITLAIMTVITLAMVLIAIFEAGPLWKMILLVSAAVIEILFIAIFIIYPPLEYRQWKYGITEDRVEIEHGIIFIERTVIPIIRIQNITVSQGPINRKYKLYDVDIAIASGSESIPCLAKETADEISNLLKDRIYKRIEENERTDI